MNNNEFFNTYVENVLAEVAELTKLRLMMKTQIDLLEVANKKLIERVKELEASSLDKPEPEEEEDIESKF
jgi:hypothetical protein